MRSGLYITAVNYHLTAHEAAYIIGDCGAKVLIISGDLADLAGELAPLIPDVSLKLMFDAAADGYASYERFRDSASPEPMADRPRGADMLYSSGTTGRPKGIKPTLPDAQVDDHEDSLVGVMSRLWGFDEGTVYLSPAPIYHAAPLRFCANVLALGGTVVMMRRFDADEALRAIHDYRVTHSQWVPTHFVRMLKLEPASRAQYDVSSLQVAVHAAAPCPVEVKQAMIDWWGPVLEEYYAGTESNGMTLIGSEAWLSRPGSVGQAVVGTLHICGDDGRELPPGEVGTIYYERDELPFEYHGDAQKTAAAQHPDHPNWTTIGDLGEVDEAGFLYLGDRRAFVIISGGVNIYPQEVENCLALHPAVHDVAVLGVPDEEMGEAVHAYVVAAEDCEPGEALADEIRGYVRERIAHYKAPRGVTFVSGVPRSATGKLVKGKMADYLQ